MRKTLRHSKWAPPVGVIGNSRFKRTILMVVLLAIVGLGLAWSATMPIEAPTVATPGQETVVLLHGLIRSERAMRKMERELRGEGYRVINHDYPSTSAPIEQLTTDVFKALDPQIKEAKRVHFVTHSLGGIILRQHLEHHKISNLGRTVMLAPPSQGSEVPDKLGWNAIFRKINGPAGNQLGTGTNSLPLRLGAPAFELGVIAGDRSINPILSTLIPGPDDGKVSIARVKPPKLTDFRRVHATHTFIARNATVIAHTKHFLAHGEFENGEVKHD
jgi:triacylglycerol lipase